MCDPPSKPFVTGARNVPGGKANGPLASGYKYVNGKKVPNSHKPNLSREAMSLFSQSDSEARSTRKPRSSRGARSGAKASVDSAPVSNGIANHAPVTAKGFASSAVPNVPFSERASAIDWDIRHERGLELPLTVCFNGSMNNFAKGQATVYSKGQAGISDTTFNPTVHAFSASDVAKVAHNPARQEALASDMAYNVARFSADCASIVPLELRVESAVNPFPFPVGIVAKHKPLNTVLCGSPYARSDSSPVMFAAVLQPGVTSCNSVSDLRHNVDVPSIERVIKYNGIDPKNDVTMAGGMATMQVRENSPTHEALQSLILDGKIAGIDFSNTTVIEGESFIQGVPHHSAKEAMRLIENTKKKPVGQMKLDNFEFTLHPLNHSRSWSDHHNSEAGHDMLQNPSVYRETLERPMCVSANLRIHHL